MDASDRAIIIRNWTCMDAVRVLTVLIAAPRPVSATVGAYFVIYPLFPCPFLTSPETILLRSFCPRAVASSSPLAKLRAALPLLHHRSPRLLRTRGCGSLPTPFWRLRVRSAPPAATYAPGAGHRPSIPLHLQRQLRSILDWRVRRISYPQ